MEKIAEALAALDTNTKTPDPDSSKPDLMGDPAMSNAVNICHNIQVGSDYKMSRIKCIILKDFLFFRGYQWSQDSEEKDKKKRKKKKKKQKYHSLFSFK